MAKKSYLYNFHANLASVKENTSLNKTINMIKKYDINQSYYTVSQRNSRAEMMLQVLFEL